MADNPTLELEMTGTSELVEITARIRPDQALALEILESSERQQLGDDFDPDALIQTALDLLIARDIFAFHVGSNQIARSSISGE